jgi:Domain of unknown function (DUF4328)
VTPRALMSTGSAFIAWFSRAYQNIERLGARDLRVKHGGAIWSWFVPILGLIRPKQIMNDIWRASDPALPEGEHRGWQSDGGLIIGAVLAVLVVRAVTSRREQRADGVSGGGSPAVTAPGLDTSASIPPPAPA